MKTQNTINILRRPARYLSIVATAVMMVHAIAVSQTQTPVNLGSTANFAVLAGSLVSNIPTSAVTGDIGLSPAAGSGITGFGVTEVTGKIYTVDATGPVGSTIAPELLTAAKGDLTIAYNNAAGRTPVPTGTFLNPGSGNIGGLSLVPGLYKFTSGASITGSDVTLTGSATDVWIFQIAAALNVGSGIKVILAGGAKAANIFWQVGTSATLGTTSVFKGTIMADQSISLGTGASLEGRALASNAAVTLASNAVNRPLVTAVENGGLAPQEFALFQNYPNPFNPSTEIRFSLARASDVRLEIYDIMGRVVATVIQEPMTAGYHKVTWEGKDNAGQRVTSGVYFYRITAGEFVATKKMVVVK